MVFPVLFVVGIVAGLVSATVCLVWMITVQPAFLDRVESGLAGKELLIGPVESTERYLYAVDLGSTEPDPVPECEVLRPYTTDSALRRLAPGEASSKEYGPGVTLRPVYEFTEELPRGRSWHLACDATSPSATPYALGPKTWPPGTPLQWTTGLITSIAAIFVWGTATGIATAIVRRR